jgi:3-dehydroquinate dehydratase/shikimate dehydrogenase
MNNGKICVSVCVETADEFIENIKRAEEFADVIELRFDCLEENQVDIFFAKLNPQWRMNKIPFIVTFRSKEQGGKRELTKEQRDYFWNSGNEIGWADLEEDIVEDSFFWLWDERICSFHDFNGVPENLQKIYKRLRATEVDIVKIAVQANDITDSIAVWKLLEQSKQENKDIVRSLAVWKLLQHAKQRSIEIIPIAMGEAGKWTRILGLAHGAFMTYAALDAGKETASGQFSARDLIETYRVKELDEQTEIYGIVGNPVAHSLSPFMHNAAYKIHNLNAVYIPFEVKNLDEFIKRFIRKETQEIELNFKGFSVTIPHKQTIIKHLDFIDETAKKIGAVNTVKVVDGKLHGYNTDAQGFIEPLKNSYGDLREAKVAILGAGGVARASIYSLKKEGAEVVIFARDLVKAKSLASEFQVELKEFPKTKTNFNNFDILVNTTPLGMKGKFENETPLLAAQIKNVKLVYDLVYNPFETRLLKEAKSVGVPTIGGLAMLAAQGAAQFKIWTGKDAPMKEMSRVALRKLS